VGRCEVGVGVRVGVAGLVFVSTFYKIVVFKDINN
jgi:hypothetical protein